MTRAGIEKPGPRVQRTAGQKQPRGLFLGRGRFPHERKVDVAGVVGGGRCLRLAEGLTEACGPGMPGPYREVKKVGCQVGARCGGGVKTPPYEWKIQWQQTQSVRAGHARPLRAA